MMVTLIIPTLKSMQLEKQPLSMCIYNKQHLSEHATKTCLQKDVRLTSKTTSHHFDHKFCQ